MEIHLYTAYANIQKLELGELVQAWNKSEASSIDVHISVTTDKYNVSRVTGSVFEVQKMRWKD